MCPGRGAHGQTDRHHTDDETQSDDKRDATYGMHTAFSFPSGRKAATYRSMPPYSRPLVLHEGQQHATLSF